MAGPITFSGPPSRLVANEELPRAPGAAMYIEIDGTRYPVVATGDDAVVTKLSLVMPDDLPAGSVEGTLMVGSAKTNVVVEVHARSRIRVEPKEVKLKSGPSASSSVTFMVTNIGNVEVDFDLEQKIVLRPAGTLARGVRTAFSHTSGDIASRIVRLGEHISAETSQELTVTNKQTLNSLKVGSHSEVIATIQIPEDLDTSITWTGRFSIMGVAVQVTVERAEAGKAKPRRTK